MQRPRMEHYRPSDDTACAFRPLQNRQRRGHPAFQRAEHDRCSQIRTLAVAGALLAG